METIPSNIETIETEAEEILEAARNKAKEIILEAKKEARKISSAHLSLDDINTEAIQIKNRAKEEAAKKVESSHLEASKLEAHANDKVNQIVEHILKVVTGVGLE